MSYIGRNIDSIDNISTLDNLSFNGSDATFNLTKNGVAFTPVSSSALNIQIDGVIQSNNYSINNATVTFDFVPSSSSVCNNIRHYGVGLLTTVSDSSITTAKLGDSAVTDAKISAMASSKLTGVVPTANLGSGTASSSTVLFGDQTFKTAPSGALNFITSAFASSNHSEVSFTNCFTSTYVNYLIIGDISVGNVGDTIRARMKNASGNLTGSEYTYRFQRYDSDSNTSTGNTRASSDTYFQLTEGLGDDSARIGYTFKIYIFDPLSTARRMGLRQESIVVNNSAVMSSVEGAGQYKGQTAITGIVFYPNANIFAESNIRIYGISNS